MPSTVVSAEAACEVWLREERDDNPIRRGGRAGKASFASRDDFRAKDGDGSM